MSSSSTPGIWVVGPLNIRPFAFRLLWEIECSCSTVGVSGLLCL